MSLRVLVVVLATQVVLGAAVVVWALAGTPSFGLFGADGKGPSVPYRDDAAYADMKRITAFGPRPAGSAASRRLAAWLRERIPHGRYEAVPGGLRNVVGELPGRGKAIVLGAHYDTKDIPGFVGANDGASGVAVVVTAARALRRIDRPQGAPELRFVLFDGEEAPPGVKFLEGGVRGSKAYAAAHAKELGALVLLDMIGDKDLAIPREAGSDRALWAKVRAAARRVGTQGAFPNRVSGAVLDDHTPFLERGVPSIDLIDFTFPVWHTTRDDMSAVSAGSIDAVGETIVELLRSGRLR